MINTIVPKKTKIIFILTFIHLVLFVIIASKSSFFKIIIIIFLFDNFVATLKKHVYA